MHHLTFRQPFNSKRLKYQVPLLTVALLVGCNIGGKPKEPPISTAPITSPQPPATSETGVTLNVPTQTFESGRYVRVPIEIKATHGGLQAASINVAELPKGVELVGLEGLAEGVTHTQQYGDGYQLNVILQEAQSAITIYAAFKIERQEAFHLSLGLSEAVDSKGISILEPVAQRISFMPGEGGQTTIPDLPNLEQQISRLRAQARIQAQGGEEALQVPQTLDGSWANYEPGDINQDRKLTLADSTLLIRFLLGQQVPTPYQAYAADLDEKLNNGQQVLDSDDYWAFVAKKSLTDLKIQKAKPFVHPLAVSANEAQPALILVGNAGYGQINIQAEASEPWIRVERLPGNSEVSTQAWQVTTDAPEGSQGELTVSYPNGEQRIIAVTALKPALPENQIIGKFNAEIEAGFSDLVFGKSISEHLDITAGNATWNAKSHVMEVDVTVLNKSNTALQGIKAIVRNQRPSNLQIISPNGYTSDDKAFVEFDSLEPGEQGTERWRIYSPEDKVGSFQIDVVTASVDPIDLTTAGPETFTNDQDTIVSIKGQDIRAETAFFIESTRLEVQSWTADSAQVIVPADFPPSTYGVMAVNPNGERAVLYPAFTIQAGDPPELKDPKEHARSFVDGYVTDIETGEPIAGATVGLPGLTVQTGSNGYFLLRGVPQGRQPIRIDALGYEPVYRFAEVHGEQQTVTLKLAELQPVHQGATMIGPEGGIHYANDGSFLKVPAGALDQTVPIEFTQLTGANALPELPQDGYFLAFARLGPVGLTFNEPATLYLPLQPGIQLEDGTPIRISYYDEREQKWVQDITGGVITTVDGRQFLEYEINHFTWIGGQFFPKAVSGRVLDHKGNPMSGVVTPYGVTDDNGVYRGSTSLASGRTTLNSSARVGSRYAEVSVDTPDVDPSTGQGSPINFPDIILPPPVEFNLPPLEIRADTDPCAAAMKNMNNTHSSSILYQNTDAKKFPNSESTGQKIIFEGIEYMYKAKIDDIAEHNMDLSTLNIEGGC